MTTPSSAPPTTTGSDIPTRALAIVLAVAAIGTLVYFVAIKPAVHRHTMDVRAERRAACLGVDEAVDTAILSHLTDTGGREVRSLRAKRSDGGWLFVSGDFAEPDVPKGFTGEIATWRARVDGGQLIVQSVDRNARDYTSLPHAPSSVSVRDTGGFDSRWCAKNAALSP
jgi:hypothetical protein